MRRYSRAPEHWWAARPLATLGLIASCTAAAVGGVELSGDLHRSAAEVPAATAVQEPVTVSATAARTAPAAVPVAVRPVALQIPSIKVDASMELLGLAGDGTLQTPADARQAGWFTGSSLPGAPGPVVIAGHVDSYTGPAVFVRLKDIKIGDPITIALSVGNRVVYKVTSVVTYAKDEFPTQSVYGPRPDSELRLITCGGAFVHGQYVDDVVVFAKLATA